MPGCTRTTATPDRRSTRGLGLLVFLTPKRSPESTPRIVFEREERSGKAVSVWGTLPSLSVGGTL